MRKLKRHSGEPSDIKITHVPVEIHSDLITISKNLGVPLSNIIKEKLREIRDSYPDYMRIPKPKD